MNSVYLSVMKENYIRLKDNLLSARRDYDAVLKQIATQGNAALEACFNTHNLLMQAERELAAHLGIAHAIPAEFEKAWQWDLGSPCPTLIQTDHTVALVYLLGSSGIEGNLVATIEFKSCVSAKLGSPNDEVNAGHPLFGKGFEGYTALRVVNSPWIDELKSINSVHDFYDPNYWVDLHHFVFGFHDSTFECVARSFEVTTAHSDIYTAAKLALEKAFS